MPASKIDLLGLGQLTKFDEPLIQVRYQPIFDNDNSKKP